MFYVYDWRINKILQAEEYQQEAGQEVLITDGDYHMYTNKSLLGSTPKEACSKAALYCARQLDFCRDAISKAQAEETKWIGFMRNAMKLQDNV